MYSILKRLGDISISLIAITLFCPVLSQLQLRLNWIPEGRVIF